MMKTITLSAIWIALITAILTTAGALSDGGELPAAPHFDEFPILTPNSGPLGITLGPDGRLWYCEFSANKIGRSTVAGVMREFALPAGSSCQEIISGQGGAYFTSTAKIGFLSTGSVLTEYSIPSGNSAIALTRMPNGDVWFVEASTRIGKLSGGIMTEYTPFAQGFIYQLFGITAGPDGNLWVTANRQGEAFVGYIYQVSPQGTLVASYFLGEEHYPTNITVGQDGALWFDDSFLAFGGVPFIGRITTTGAITEYDVPGGSLGYTHGITAGPGGLWFGYNSQLKIGRITYAGAITEFTAPGAASRLIRGPDGAIWFTDTTTNSLGRYGP